ncbi:hypothetical protein [Nostoc sp. MG11]|uniref:hypothetical protein n=1 Tax=Nostoc sp. MG11 TaxID=2721166 RepID=UPI001865CB46|nr:hypothetical protein [Nostoc sp. MG11]
MPQNTAIALQELETVEISFYDQEVYAAGKLIASITHDDDLTQPWLVLINGVEVFRHDTQKRCHSYIVWHYKENTLPEPEKPVVVKEVKAYVPEPQEAELEVQTQEVTAIEPRHTVQLPGDWDFTLPKFDSTPVAICPDCGGHGCGNCAYRGTRCEDLCTPVDDYRLTYVGRTNIQTAHNVYTDGEFLGILFKVRNLECPWRNDPKTYYWRCGNGIQYWSVKEAIVTLSRVTAPVKSEVPTVYRELVVV